MVGPIRWSEFELHPVDGGLALHDEAGQVWRVRLCSEVTPLLANWYAAVAKARLFAHFEIGIPQIGLPKRPSRRLELRQQRRANDAWIRASRRLLDNFPEHAYGDEILRLLTVSERGHGEALHPIEMCLTRPRREGHAHRRLLVAYLFAFDEFACRCDELEGTDRSLNDVLSFLLMRVPTCLRWRVLEWDHDSLQKQMERLESQANIPALVEAVLRSLIGEEGVFQRDAWPSRDECRAADPLGPEYKQTFKRLFKFTT
jgi:hypothetical protein